MTEERAERNRKNSEKLIKIIKWSYEHNKLWKILCVHESSGITVDEIEALLEECIFNGYMELYYLLLSMVCVMMNIKLHSPNFIKFIEISLNKNFQLDLEQIKEHILNDINDN